MDEEEDDDIFDSSNGVIESNASAKVVKTDEDENDQTGEDLEEGEEEGEEVEESDSVRPLFVNIAVVTNSI